METIAINEIEQCYRQLRAVGHPVLRLFSGNPQEHGIHFPPAILQAAYQDFLNDADYRPDPRGLLEARIAIADYYATQGWMVDPEQIILTSGTSESLGYIFTMLSRPGDKFMIPQPSYPLLQEVAKVTRVELIPYLLEETCAWSPKLTWLDAAPAADLRGVVIVSPNNPTGAVMQLEEIKRIAKWANKYGLPLICDEVFADFYFGGGSFPRPAVIARPNLCFTLNGISKMLALPALKLSWIVISGTTQNCALARDRLETIADTFLSCNTPVQRALPRLLAESVKFREDYYNIVGQRRNLLLRIIEQTEMLQLNPPQGGFYCMISLPSLAQYSEDEIVMELMRRYGVFAHPGYFYDYDEGPNLVVSFITREEDIERGLDAMVKLASV